MLFLDTVLLICGSSKAELWIRIQSQPLLYLTIGDGVEGFLGSHSRRYRGPTETHTRTMHNAQL